MKRIIKVQMHNVSGWDLHGTLKSARDHIDYLITQYGEDAKLDWDSDHHEAYEDSPSPCFHLGIDREETDKEYAKRMGREEQYKIMQLEQDRKMLAELKKKLGEE